MNRRKEEESSGQQEKKKFVPLGDIYKALDDVPTPLRGKILNRLTVKEVPAEEAAEMIKTELPLDSKTADQLLDEVSRRVYGFSIDELEPSERREVESIKKDLGIKDL